MHDADAARAHIAERAFLHLQRLIVADDAIRKKWSTTTGSSTRPLDQDRKPLVGDGGIPVSFQLGALAGGTLIAASDGLFRYAKREDIVRVAHGRISEALGDEEE